MTDEAKIEFEKFKATQGFMILSILEKFTPNVEEKFGQDAAFGFVLGIDLVHEALTGFSLKEIYDEVDADATK